MCALSCIDFFKIILQKSGLWVSYAIICNSIDILDCPLVVLWLAFLSLEQSELFLSLHLL